MESTVRDYNKLINYYHKLSNQEDSDYTNTPSSSNALKLSLSASNSPMTDSSLYSSLPVYFTTQTSIQNNKATTKSEDETEFQNENIQAVKFARELEPPKSLNLFESTTKFNANRSSPNFLTASAQTLVQSPSYDSFKLSQLSVTTPTPTTDEPTGSFIMKKKLDDEGAGNSNRWTSGHHRKRLNTKKPKTNKVGFLFLRTFNCLGLLRNNKLYGFYFLKFFESIGSKKILVRIKFFYFLTSRAIKRGKNNVINF